MAEEPGQSQRLSMRFKSKSCFNMNVDGATTTQEDPSPNPTLWAKSANFPFRRKARSVSLTFQERLKRRNDQHLSEELGQPTAQEETAPASVVEPEERKKNRPSFSTALRRIFRKSSPRKNSHASTVCADSEAEDNDDDDENYCSSTRSQAAFDNPSTVAMKFMASRLHQSMLETSDVSGSRDKSHSVSSQLMHNRCANCNKSYLRGLSRSSHFCTKDCKTSWTLRTGESSPGILRM